MKLQHADEFAKRCFGDTTPLHEQPGFVVHRMLRTHPVAYGLLLKGLASVFKYRGDQSRLGRLAIGWDILFSRYAVGDECDPTLAAFFIAIDYTELITDALLIGRLNLDNILSPLAHAEEEVLVAYLGTMPNLEMLFRMSDFGMFLNKVIEHATQHVKTMRFIVPSKYASAFASLATAEGWTTKSTSPVIELSVGMYCVVFEIRTFWATLGEARCS